MLVILNARFAFTLSVIQQFVIAYLLHFADFLQAVIKWRK